MLDESRPEPSIDALLDAFSEAVADHVGDLPLFIAGWSVGGAEAPALAELLARRAREVRHVFLLDPPLPSEHPRRQRELRLYQDLTGQLLDVLDRVEADGSWLADDWPTAEVMTLLERLRTTMMAGEKPARMRRLATVQAAQKAAFAEFRFMRYTGPATLLAADHAESTDPGIAEWSRLLPAGDVVRVGGRHTSFVIEDTTRLPIARLMDSVVSAV
jgi:thioesterase domain-containing protein